VSTVMGQQIGITFQQECTIIKVLQIRYLPLWKERLVVVGVEAVVDLLEEFYLWSLSYLALQLLQVLNLTSMPLILQ
jgi:hypothetical protein